MNLETIRRLTAPALLFFAFAADATITVAPGSMIQPARRGATFPAPVRLLVVDDQGRPVVGQQVSFLTQRSTFALPFDAGFYSIFATTDSQGIATLSPLTGIAVGKTIFDVDAYPYGSMQLELEVADAPLPARVLLVSAPQAAISAGATASTPFQVQVVDTLGNGIPFATVSFDAFSTPLTRGSFDGDQGVGIVADAQGVATSPLLTINMADPTSAAIPGMYPANGTLRAINSYGGGEYISTQIAYTVTTPDVPATAQDLWWGGPAETGWGVSVIEHPDAYAIGPGLYPRILFVVLFVYDENGKPVWYVMPSGQWTSGYGTKWQGPLLKASGAPFHDYDAASLSIRPGHGDATLTFIGSSVVKLEYEIYGSSVELGRGTKRLQRLDFSNEGTSPRRGVADLWWGGESQNGWGLAVHERQGALFSLWFTYGDDRTPT